MYLNTGLEESDLDDRCYIISLLISISLGRSNPLGMKGHIAQRYGELVKDLWSGTSKTIAPLKLRVSSCHCRMESCGTICLVPSCHWNYFDTKATVTRQ